MSSPASSSTLLSSILGSVVAAFALAQPLTARADTPPESPVSPSIQIAGQIQLIPGFPCVSCPVTIDGTPLGGRTDANGWFAIANIPGGSTWTVTARSADGQHTHKATVATPALEPTRNRWQNFTINLAPIVITRPGAIAGKLTLDSTDDLDEAVIAIPEQGIFVQPSVTGAYLLPGVAPGSRSVVLLLPRRRAQAVTTSVQPGVLTRGINFEPIVIGTPIPNPTH